MIISKNALKELKGKSDLEIALELNKRHGNKITRADVFKARRQHGYLTKAEEEQIRQGRRKIIASVAGSGILLVAGATGVVIYERANRPIVIPTEYELSVHDERRRQSHIDSIIVGRIPDSVIYVKYATPQLLEKLAQDG
ncbi:hypothetical protein HY637_00150 [Candidatus Woesearchaeota archaeon]|nr:hypothetical protein [Candidatus Woesearchaeota archaeon]